MNANNNKQHKYRCKYALKKFQQNQIFVYRKILSLEIKKDGHSRKGCT